MNQIFQDVSVIKVILYFLIVSSVCDVKHVVQENVVDGSSLTRFPLVIGDSEPDIPGIEPLPLGWHTSTPTTELKGL